MTTQDPFQGSCIILYGPPKVGKTQTAASFPTPFFICTEPGHRYLEAKKLRLMPQLGWSKFKKWLESEAIERMKPKTVVIDTVVPLYQMCFDYVCKQERISHPEDTKHGKGWAAIRREFFSVLQILSSQCENAGATQLWIAHARIVEYQMDQKKISKIEVDMPGQTRAMMMPVPDHVWYLGYETPKGGDPFAITTKNRRLWLKATSIIEGGCRNPAQMTGSIAPLPETNQYAAIVARVNEEKKK